MWDGDLLFKVLVMWAIIIGVPILGAAFALGAWLF